MVRIPAEYQEVEYIENTGTQYIATDYISGDNPVVECKMSQTVVPTGDNMLFGWNNGTNSLYIEWYSKIGYAYGACGNSRYAKVTIPDIVLNTPFELTVTEESITSGSTVIEPTGSFSSISQSQPMYIFAWNAGTKYINKGARLYRLTINCSSGDSADFVPCYRKSDSKPGMYDTVSGTFYVNQGTGEFLVGNNVYYDTTNLLESRRRILLTTPHLESPTPANPLTFKSNMTTKLKEGKVYFTPIQEGTGDPSPDNVRPITGWDGITVTKCGKNIANLNENDMLSYSWTKAFPNPFKKACRYTISCQNNIVANNGNTGAFVFLGNAVTDSSGYGMTSWDFGKRFMNASFNITAEALTKNYIVFRFNGYPTYAAISNAQIQIEEGSEATAYEPYTETKITIPFPQTIYGGYVDLVNGEVVEDLYCYDFAVETPIWSSPPTNTDNQYFAPSPEMKTGYLTNTNQTFSSALKKVINNALGVGVRFGANNRTVYFYNMSEIDGIETGNDVRTWIKDNNLVIVYPLATPIHHTIDPQVIRPLKGVNNIYSDANGNIEIKFWRH